MFNINVKGSTNAGVRYIKPLKRWTCERCGLETDKFSCPNVCGTRREG